MSAPTPIGPIPAAKPASVPPKPTPKWKQYGTPLLIVLLAIAVVFTITRNWNSWEGGRSSQVTDNAYIRGDLTPLSTKVSGIVGDVRVSDHQEVRKGDVLVQLEDADYKAQVAQATAAVEAAKAALETMEKASAAVSLAKREYVPDVEAFARYSYQENVPFLARNFGSFGVHLGYDLFDGGRKRAVLREREAQLAQSREKLARVTEKVELGVQTAYNKLDRTRQMVKVSEELLVLRAESSRVSAQQLARGEALRSQANAAVAQELDAKTLLLQSQLDYIQARDELIQAMGETPE